MRYLKLVRPLSNLYHIQSCHKQHSNKETEYHLVLIHVEFYGIKITYGIWNVSQLVVRQVDDIKCPDGTQLNGKCFQFIVCQ